jgi:hypothetical protein
MFASGWFLDPLSEQVGPPRNAVVAFLRGELRGRYDIFDAYSTPYFVFTQVAISTRTLFPDRTSFATGSQP